MDVISQWYQRISIRIPCESFVLTVDGEKERDMRMWKCDPIGGYGFNLSGHAGGCNHTREHLGPT